MSGGSINSGMISHSTDPFPYWIIDDFLPTEMAQDAYTYFFDGEGKWTRRHHLYSRHKETRTTGLSWPVEQALRHLESPIVMATLTKLTGIGPLSSDPDRFGGGQHVTYEGGSLGIHADFTHHPTTGMRRALNLLLYLNKTVLLGAALELWDKEVKQCVKRIEPTFNKAVIFATSPTSFHGHPEPLMTRERRSLACYYYVPETYTPFDWSRVLRTTDYRPRPWEYGLRLRRWVSKLVKG